MKKRMGFLFWIWLLMAGTLSLASPAWAQKKPVRRPAAAPVAETKSEMKTGARAKTPTPPKNQGERPPEAQAIKSSAHEKQVEEQAENPTESKNESSLESKSPGAGGRGPGSQQGLSLAWVNWPESLKIDQGGLIYEQPAIYYGFDLSFSSRWYWGRKGIELTIGTGQGSSNTGESTDTTGYYQRRIAWNSYRAELAALYRFSRETHFGVAGGVRILNTKWPESTTGVKARGAINPLSYLAVKWQWNFSGSWGLHQTFGASDLRNSSFWLLGLQYIF